MLYYQSLSVDKNTVTIPLKKKIQKFVNNDTFYTSQKHDKRP